MYQYLISIQSLLTDISALHNRGLLPILYTPYYTVCMYVLGNAENESGRMGSVMLKFDAEPKDVKLWLISQGFAK